jgi:hypothetical protein
MAGMGLLLLLALSTPPGGDQKIERRMAISPDASIRIHNLYGVTRIIGWDRDSLVVTGTVPSEAGTFYMGGAGRAAKLGIEPSPGAAGAPLPSLEIRVPRGARLWVKSLSAGVTATGLSGELECSSVSGQIRVEGSLHLLVAESMEGNLNVAGPMEVVRLKGGTGSITLRGPRGDVQASTVGGALVATDAALTRAHLETVSGTITYEGTVAPTGTLEAVTHSGDVILRLPPSLGAEFDLESFDGSIAYGLSSKGEGAPKPFKGKPLTLTAGDGQARVMVRTFKGEIRILKP